MAPTTGDKERLRAAVAVSNEALPEGVNQVSAEELADLIRLPVGTRRGNEAHGGVVLVDCRQPAEVAISTINKAIRLDNFDTSMTRGKEGEAMVVVFCGSGRRSAIAAKQLQLGAGCQRIFILSGGLASWCHIGGPLAGPDGKPTTDIFVLEKMDLPLFPRNRQYKFLDKSDFHAADQDAQFDLSDSPMIASAKSPGSPVAFPSSPSAKAKRKSSPRRSASTPNLRVRREAYSMPLIMPGSGAGKRDVNFGERLFRSAQERHGRLERLRELQRQQEEAEATRLILGKRRIGTEKEADGIFSNLYGHARERALKEKEREAKENKYWADKRTPVQREVNPDEKNSGVPHYERLHADHAKRLKHLEQALQQRKAAEQKYCETALNKLHKDVIGEDEDANEVVEEMVKRLYSEHKRRVKKLDKERKKFESEEKAIIAKHWVHGPNPKLPEDDVLAITDRLYKDGERKKEGIQKRIDEEDAKWAARRENPFGDHKRKELENFKGEEDPHERLYNEAATRRERIEKVKEEKINKELKYMAEKSVHAGKELLNADSLEILIDRLYEKGMKDKLDIGWDYSDPRLSLSEHPFFRHKDEEWWDPYEDGELSVPDSGDFEVQHPDLLPEDWIPAGDWWDPYGSEASDPLERPTSEDMVVQHPDLLPPPPEPPAPKMMPKAKSRPSDAGKKAPRKTEVNIKGKGKGNKGKDNARESYLKLMESFNDDGTPNPNRRKSVEDLVGDLGGQLGNLENLLEAKEQLEADGEEVEKAAPKGKAKAKPKAKGKAGAAPALAGLKRGGAPRAKPAGSSSDKPKSAAAVQMENKMWDIFSSLDKDGEGTISCEELVHGLANMPNIEAFFGNLSAEELLELIDADGDRVITWEELKDVMPDEGFTQEAGQSALAKARQSKFVEPEEKEPEVSAPAPAGKGKVGNGKGGNGKGVPIKGAPGKGMDGKGQRPSQLGKAGGKGPGPGPRMSQSQGPPQKGAPGKGDRAGSTPPGKGVGKRQSKLQQGIHDMQNQLAGEVDQLNAAQQQLDAWGPWTDDSELGGAWAPAGVPPAAAWGKGGPPGKGFPKGGPGDGMKGVPPGKGFAKGGPGDGMKGGPPGGPMKGGPPGKEGMKGGPGMMKGKGKPM